MKTSKRILCMLLAIVMTLSMGTLAMADTPTPPSTPASNFTFGSDGSSTTVYLGRARALDYTVQPSGYDGGLTYTSTNTSVATVDASGTVTPVKAGTTTIKVKVYTMEGEKEFSCNVTVTADSVTKFEFTDEDDTYYINEVTGTVTVGTKATFTSGTIDTEKTYVGFHTEDPSVAEVSNSGVVTGKAAGSTILYADYYFDGKKVKTAEAEIVVKGGTVTIDQKEELEGSAKFQIGVNETARFTATVEPDSLDSRLKWTVSTASTVATIDNSGNFEAKGVNSNITVTAYLDLDDDDTFDQGEPSDTISVQSKKKPLEDVKLGNATLAINGEKTLTPVLDPASASLDDYDLLWSSSDETVATVDSEGKVKAKASGTTTIMLQLRTKGTDTIAFIATSSVTVQNATYNTSVSAQAGTNKTMGVASTIAREFKSKTGCTSNPTTISIDSITGTNSTLIYTSSYISASAATAKSYTYSEFSSLYLKPKTAGTYYVDYTAVNGSYRMTGTITIRVTANTKNIVIELDSSRGDYVFTSDANSDDLPAYEIITDTIGVTYSYIMFGDIDVWNDDDVGTLYASSSSSADSVEDDGVEYRNSSSGSNRIRNLCFTPNGDEGSFVIEYTAYNSSDVSVASGTLTITVGAVDADVTVTLDSDDPYYFDDETEEDEESAYGLLWDFVYYETDEDPDDTYIEFTDFVDDDAGILYYDDDEDTEVETEVRYDFDEIMDFYFVPEEAGTYEVEFSVYDGAGRSADEIAYGLLSIIVPGDGSGDVSITLDNKNSYDFDEETDEDEASAYDLIVDYIDDNTNKTVSYIRFGSVTSGSDVGGLYIGTSLNSTKVTTAHKFYLDALNSSTALEEVTFEPSKGGTFVIKFTAYTSSGSSACSGELAITVPGGSSSVAETGDIVIHLDEDADEYYFGDETEEDEDSAYNMIINYVDKEIDIDLEREGYIMFYRIHADDAGTLYADDDETELDEDEEYYDTEIEDFYFVPEKGGSYEIEFDVYDDEDELVDEFILQIIVPGATTSTQLDKTVTCYSNGYTFKATDFYTLADSDPIMSVTFSLPTSGKLSVNVKNGKGTGINNFTEFYTTTSAYGDYNITALTYIPKAGFSGNVALDYVAQTRKGNEVEGTITMAVKTKTASSKFSDVTAANTGSWSANAIDFANAWGLVNGTTTTAPFKFEPTASMKRCDILLMLYRAAGEPAVTGTVSYKDVPTTAYYYKAVVWAAKNGIITGAVTSTTTFAPSTATTREEFATFLYNYTKYTGASVTNTGSIANYTDVNSVSTYAKAAMTWAVSKGYITSNDASKLVLAPKVTANRAMIATMLHRYFTY